MSWTINKSFNVSYGHRVWTQVLNTQYTQEGHIKPKCKHKHGHNSDIIIYLESNTLKAQGFVEDFSHLGWVKDFLDDTIDHKFIVDTHDPAFTMVTCGTLSKDNEYFDTTSGIRLALRDVYAVGTRHKVGVVIDTTHLIDDYQKEIYEGLFLVDFVPTSENLSKWVFDIVDAKMSLINARATKVEWWETPKSCSTYYRPAPTPDPIPGFGQLGGTFYK